MGLLDRIAAARAEARNATAISIYDWAKMFSPGEQVTYGGNTYQAWQVNQGPTSPAAGYIEANPVVFACVLNRVLLFSEARFQFQQLRGGRPGDLFGTDSLAVLEQPWAGATTRDLLIQMELDVARHGNSYWVNDGPFLQRLDPAKVKILTELATDQMLTGYQIGERLLAYAYMAGDDRVVIYEPGEICHYKSPLTAPTNRFVGSSWLSPCLPDIDADELMTGHKRAHLRNGAAVPFTISYDAGITPEQFAELVRVYKEQHSGPENSGKPLHIGGGADVKTIGQTFEQLAFKATQGHTETRIAACAGVPPVIVGLSEGLAAATYSNYGQARRRLVDGTMRPLWGATAGALQSVVAVPGGSRLWYDDRDIPFLREDVKDQAAILKERMLTIESGVRGGFEPDSVVDAVTSDDLARLVHTGLYSVQLQPPMTGVPVGNGSTPVDSP